jgi:pyruvate dehydrogenase (quinone)
MHEITHILQRPAQPFSRPRLPLEHIMSKKKVAQIIIETLQAAGVQRCYGIVGDTLNYVTDAISRSEIEWVHVRHEEVGAFASGAEAYMTGNLTACAGSCGPGSLHFINGIYESHRNRAPVVLIASQVATAEMGIEFPQNVDFMAIYKNCSVYCETLINPAQARRMTTLAAQTALTKRGVAVLIVPSDISNLEVDDTPGFHVHLPTPVIRPSEMELDHMAHMLNFSGKIAVYAGAGCEGASAEVVALCAALQAPMAHTSRAKDFVEFENPYNVGMTGIFGVSSGYHAVMGCETLLLLGADFAWQQFYPEQARIIQIDIDPSHLGRRHPIELGVVGDIKPTLQALIPRLKVREDRHYLDHCLNEVEHVKHQLAHEERAGKEGIIHPQQLAMLIDKYADQDAVFTADGGSAMVWLLRHIRSTGKRRTLLSLLHGTMANAMPQALGIKKAWPQRQVIALCGDGGLTMLLGDLITTIQENIAIKIVVINNGTLGFVELEQKVEGLLDAYTELKNPNFAKLAEVIGLYGDRVEHSDDLEAAVQAFLQHDGPALLDVTTNRSELVMPPKIEASYVYSTALFSMKAIAHGRSAEVVDLISSNFLK